MQSKRKKLKIYREEVKERQTTHWDLDYMSTAELEAAMAARPDPKKATPTPAASPGLPGLIKRLFTVRLGKLA